MDYLYYYLVWNWCKYDHCHHESSNWQIDNTLQLWTLIWIKVLELLSSFISVSSSWQKISKLTYVCIHVPFYCCLQWMRCFFTCQESITSSVQWILTAADVFENVHQLLNTTYIFNPSPSTWTRQLSPCLMANTLIYPLSQPVIL